jgi:hypothetical protein
MRCPHCGGHILDNAAKLRRRRHAKGLCCDCGGFLSPKDKEQRRWRCFTCRVHKQELARRRDARKRQKAA